MITCSLCGLKAEDKTEELFMEKRRLMGNLMPPVWDWNCGWCVALEEIREKMEQYKITAQDL